MRLLITVMMPTMVGREAFARRAARQLAAQKPGPAGGINVELLVVQNEGDPDLRLGAFSRVLRVPPDLNLGQRRNRAVQAASGDILVLWDDDDWSGPRRLVRLVEPLILGRADLITFRDAWCAYIGGRFWKFGKLGASYVDGSLCTWKKHLLEHPFGDGNVAEILWTVGEMQRAGLRQLIVDAGMDFCIVRHDRNTWEFREDEYLTPATAPHGPMKEAGTWPETS